MPVNFVNCGINRHMINEINSKGSRTARAIARAWLIVGTLDILAAVVLTLLRDANPLGTLRFIASGVFGAEAFAGGLPYALLGLLFHYCIAMIWTLIFFFIAAPVTNVRRHPILAGVVYGVVVWLAMNLIVLPLSNIPPVSMTFGSAAIGMSVLIAAVGLPLAFLAARNFKTM
jgi:hypothetical protein